MLGTERRHSSRLWGACSTPQNAAAGVHCLACDCSVKVRQDFLSIVDYCVHISSKTLAKGSALHNSSYNNPPQRKMLRQMYVYCEPHTYRILIGSFAKKTPQCAFQTGLGQESPKGHREPQKSALPPRYHLLASNARCAHRPVFSPTATRPKIHQEERDPPFRRRHIPRVLLREERCQYIGVWVVEQETPAHDNIDPYIFA